MPYAIELKRISKYFPGVKANDAISLAVERGKILALVGENGAGKTTLMKILYGLYQPDEGEIYIEGQRHQFQSPLDAIKSGLGMVHQHFMLFSDLTVVENIIYGMEPKKAGFLKKAEARALVTELSCQYKLDVDPNARVGDLPVGVRQRVEILKALYRQAKILIFDEPTAVLTPQERVKFFDVLHNLARDEDKTIIFISHKLNEVLEISDRVSVMRHGKITANLITAETNALEISRYMVGRDIDFNLERSYSEAGQTVLDVQKLNVFNKDNLPVVKDLSLNVCAGEIVGIAGVAGNGQDELIRALTGLSDANYVFGKVYLNGKEISTATNQQRRAMGLSYIPEDRNTLGLAIQAEVAENLSLGYWNRPEICKKGILQRAGLEAFSKELVNEFQIKTSDVHEATSNLSGGNLQKIVVAREVHHGSRLLIAEQPTRGVDVGSIELIHRYLLRQRAEQKAILLVSTELSEIMALSDRILVMFEGGIAGELDHESATEERLGLLMAGIKPDFELENASE